MRFGKWAKAGAAVALALAAAGESGLAPGAPASQPAAVGPCPRAGYGPGPGMMGGYGQGPGMMGGGYGMGRGMMGGYGMGPGMMMGSPGWARMLQLTDDQRAKINRIADEARKAHWALMGEMMDRQARLRDLYEAPKRDDAAIDEAYKGAAALRQKMFDVSADARKRMEAVLTSKQIDQLRSYEKQDDVFGW